MPSADHQPRFRLSLRGRLTAAFAVAMAVLLAGLAVFVWVRVGGELTAALDRDLRARADALTAQLRSQSRPALDGGYVLVDPDEAFAQVLDERGRVVEATPGLGGRPLLTRAEVRAVDRPSFFTLTRSGEDGRRLLALPVTLGGRPQVAVVGATLGDRRDAQDQLLATLAIAGPVALALATLAGWALAGAALRPVERMRRRAAELSATDPDGSLPVPATGDELTALATTLNDLLDRQRRAAAAQRRFVDEASHELRTPLTVLKAELDLTLTRPRSVPELETAVRAAARETDRLVRFSEDLLALARLSPEGLPLRREPTSLPALVDQTVEATRRLAAEVGAEVRTDVPDATVWLDRVRVRQALGNLVENALRYGRGPVTVGASVSAAAVEVSVRDHGAGFPGMDPTALFEPFTRGTRTVKGRPPRDGGSGGECDGIEGIDAADPTGIWDRPGAGLGLAIVRAVAESHGGSVTASNEPSGGARVDLLLRTDRWEANQGRRPGAPADPVPAG